MPKIKTKKAIAKRFKITKNGKVIKRSTGQAHFNARATGNAKRNKRSDSLISAVTHKTIKKLMPYA